MTLTTHAATGILVTQLTANPVLGFFAAVASHYFTDAIPHGDEFIYWRHVHNSKDYLAISVAATDLFILILITLATLSTSISPTTTSTTMALGIFGGILPDLLITLHTKNRKKFRAHATDYATPTQQLQRIYHAFLQTHFKFHMAFHNTMRIPIRFRTALMYQTVFLLAFIYIYL